jgi:hypothetical protein
MERRGLILGLVTLAVVVSLFLGADPEHAQKIAQMRREIAFTGESRETVLLLLAIGLGGFIAYLTLRRR